jgi:hypothetical protein
MLTHKKRVKPRAFQNITAESIVHDSVIMFILLVIYDHNVMINNPAATANSIYIVPMSI